MVGTWPGRQTAEVARGQEQGQVSAVVGVRLGWLGQVAGVEGSRGLAGSDLRRAAGL